MWLQRSIKRAVGRRLTGARRLVLRREVPALESRLDALPELGLYLHVPFCRQICPYCPYNKELFDADLAQRYTQAALREIDIYADLVGHKPVTSFYIGGGTPTTLLHAGLDRILEHVYASFPMQCDVHLESHVNDLSHDNLGLLLSLGVKHLSIGVEALQDRHLRTLCRPYTVDQAMAAVNRAVHAGFDCVNVDAIFALPGQTLAEIEELGHRMVALGADQVTTYPLFEFPYTRWPQLARQNGYRRFGALRKRRMLRTLEHIFYDAGFRRSSVWAFTRSGVPRYCSVTVPLYLGLGASGSSYLRDVFYVNTFNVRAYCEALEQGRLPIALSLDLSPDMQMAGWLYWRLYETRFRKSRFYERFGRSFDEVFGKYFKLLALAGFLTDDGDEIVCSDRGTYWLHWVEDLFSIDYVGALWGTSGQQPWPQEVVLTV
ncbi:MAG TPA: radical SAM protein [Phycisphaerae bacterium]|nr:radical SAM protein [Phycisphaerae bacterium]HNU45256.1 radical SAM protein [Phycisphaerae bacterium]